MLTNSRCNTLIGDSLFTRSLELTTKMARWLAFGGDSKRHTPRCSYRRASFEPTKFSSRPKWAS